MRKTFVSIAAAALMAVPTAAHAAEDGPIKVGTDQCHAVVNSPVNVGTRPPYVSWEPTEPAPFWIYCPLG
jgi:hypothetical protein